MLVNNGRQLKAKPCQEVYMKSYGIGLGVLLLCFVLLPVTLFGGAKPETQTQEQSQAAVATGRYREAPMLAERVRKGEIPPVDERLPENPLVWDHADVLLHEEGIGKYGGTLRMPNWRCGPMAISHIAFARITADRTGYVPDIAESYEFADDYTSVTFRLRKGMKWSDGYPFTTDDIMFWWNDIINWKGHAAPVLTGIKSITQIDEVTVRLDFEDPYPNFLFDTRGFAGGERGWGGINGTHLRVPAHYMKKLHPDYTPTPGMSAEEQMNRLIDSNKSPNVPYMEDTDKPVIWAWKPVEFREGQFLRMERNAYFWTVDREGNQLPYIDYVESEMIYDSDKELIKLKLLSGEAHVEFRSMRSPDVPLLAESPRLDIVKVLPPFGAPQGIYVNYNNPDPVKREVFRNPDFRRALSIAIDRQLINETAHLNQGRPGMGISAPGVFDPDIDGRWTFYDPDKANAMLDDVGLDKRDREGYRLLPNGERFDFTLLFTPDWGEGATETAEIATQNWREVGIRANAHAGTETAITARLETEDWDSNVRCVWGGLMILDWFPALLRWAVSQRTWWDTKDQANPRGVEPEPGSYVRRLLEIKDEIDAKNTGQNPEEIEVLMAELREIYADQMFGFGIVQDVKHPVPVNKNLKNVWGRKSPLILHFGEEEIWFRGWYLEE
jgi:peptide/nickel transport system substrate-binding protein